MIPMYDVCILGGGASGLATAISIAKLNSDTRICILEKNSELGKKILATGNGRCNISNEEAYGVDTVSSFFDDIYVDFLSIDKRYYPYSKKASDVRDALLIEISKYSNIEVLLNSNVLKVSHEDNFFSCSLKNSKIESKTLVIAAGGKSGPQYGTVGDGFSFSKNLGHNLSKVYPGLTSIETVEDVSILKGIRHNCLVRLSYEGKNIFTELGEVQFTNTGLSGICIFNMSNHITRGLKSNWKEDLKSHKVSLDLLPDYSESQVLKLLSDRKNLKSRKLISLIDSRLEEYIGEVTLENIKDLTFNISSVDGFDRSQVTIGGVLLDEVEKNTQESKLIKNLFLVGEVLDYSGICGGFNLNHAWLTGIKAGRYIASL